MRVVISLLTSFLFLVHKGDQSKKSSRVCVFSVSVSACLVLL